MISLARRCLPGRARHRRDASLLMPAAASCQPATISAHAQHAGAAARRVEYNTASKAFRWPPWRDAVDAHAGAPSTPPSRSSRRLSRSAAQTLFAHMAASASAAMSLTATYAACARTTRRQARRASDIAAPAAYALSFSREPHFTHSSGARAAARQPRPLKANTAKHACRGALDHTYAQMLAG